MNKKIIDGYYPRIADDILDEKTESMLSLLVVLKIDIPY